MSDDAEAPHVANLRGESSLIRFERSLEGIAGTVASVGVIGMLTVAGATLYDVLIRWIANSGVLALNEITTLTFAVSIWPACRPASRGAFT